MSTQWAPIRYRDFYDFPRAFVVEHSGELLFFDCPFDDALDDYGREFTVFRIKSEFRDRINQPSWKDLRHYGERIGVVPTDAIRFDETRRQAIDEDVFALLDKNQ